MFDIVAPALSAFGVIFVAELGDKTQLLALGFGARHGIRTVIVGLTIGYACAGAFAAVVGGMLGATLPDRPLGIAAAVLFIVFAVITFLDRDDGGDAHDTRAVVDESGPRRSASTRAIVLSIAVSIAIGELGDKTQLATATLASRSNPVAVWIGATTGEVSAGAMGAFVGLRLGTRLRPDALRLVSAVLFAVFGLVLFVMAI